MAAPIPDFIFPLLQSLQSLTRMVPIPILGFHEGVFNNPSFGAKETTLGSVKNFQSKLLTLFIVAQSGRAQ